MKKTSIVITTLLVMVAIAVAVVSCKKDTQNATSNPKNQSAQAFDPSHITDMNAYLKEFKQKMKQSQFAKDSETMSLEEAAWHLSSVANYDFANANAGYSDMRFDTLRYHIGVSNGTVNLSDLNEVYGEISTDIDAFYHGLDLDNKHFHFIGASISEEGLVEMSLITSYSWYGIDQHLWHFPNEYYADSVCDEFFIYENYYAAGLGCTELERILNLMLGHSTDPTSPGGYYTISRSRSFYYRDYIDPYYVSASYLSSRLFATDAYLNPDISVYMCMYLDSYADLALQYRPNDMDVVSVGVQYRIENPFEQYHEHFRKGIHDMTVNYGILSYNPGNEY